MKIIITGGSRGIGRKIAEYLSDQHEIIVLSKNDESIATIKEDLKVSAYKVDTSDQAAVMKFFQSLDTFDVLINCAGILGPVGFLVENDMQSWISTIQTNLLGTVLCCKHAIPKLSEFGKIINISGGGAAFPRTYHTSYACSKVAVVRFTEIIAKELELNNKKITVNVLAPGAHKTDMWNEETHDKAPDTWANDNDLFSMISFLIKNTKVTGRFIHIKDDKMELMNNENEDLFTLRRIDNFKFMKK